MKKIMIIVLVLSSVFLISCGKKSETSSSSTANALPQPSIDCGGSDCL